MVSSTLVAMLVAPGGGADNAMAVFLNLRRTNGTLDKHFKWWYFLQENLKLGETMTGSGVADPNPQQHQMCECWATHRTTASPVAVII